MVSQPFPPRPGSRQPRLRHTIPRRQLRAAEVPIAHALPPFHRLVCPWLQAAQQQVQEYQQLVTVPRGHGNGSAPASGATDSMHSVSAPAEPSLGSTWPVGGAAAADSPDSGRRGNGGGGIGMGAVAFPVSPQTVANGAASESSYGGALGGGGGGAAAGATCDRCLQPIDAAMFSANVQRLQVAV